MLRVVRTAPTTRPRLPGATADWFMDYRNADGSVAEMCGNGIRVFARYLVDAGLDAGRRRCGRAPAAAYAGRGCGADGDVTVDMGPAAAARDRRHKVAVGGPRSGRRSTSTMGNPHAVVFVDDLAEAGDLLEPAGRRAGRSPTASTSSSSVRVGDRHLAMRVHERGVGETRSCGTGACAVMVGRAARRDGGRRPGRTSSTSPAGGSPSTERRRRARRADRPGRARAPQGDLRLLSGRRTGYRGPTRGPRGMSPWAGLTSADTTTRTRTGQHPGRPHARRRPPRPTPGEPSTIRR